MKQAFARAVYSTLLRLLTPAYLARLWWRGRREPGYRLAWGERLGFAGSSAAAPGAVWLHAVSLGETRAAVALIDALRQGRPGLRLLLTHGTATGREAGKALLRAGDSQAWLPYDTPGAVRRFLRAHGPVVGVLMETEIWPNLQHEAARAGLTLVLANARLSARSARKAARLPALMRPAAAALTQVLAQTEADAQRLRVAGAPLVIVCGNLKYDLRPEPVLLVRGALWRERLARPVVVAANTRDGEERALLAAWRRGAPEHASRPLLLIVPRHPQRFDDVAGQVLSAGFSLARRSAWAELPPAEVAAADVWLGDSLGELPLYYACGDVALLGGSFQSLGGHNLIEAAACGCPVILGPSTFNFADAAERALQAGAAWRVADFDEAVARALALLAAPQERAAAAAHARRFAAEHGGAATRMAERILALMP